MAVAAKELFVLYQDAKGDVHSVVRVTCDEVKDLKI